ncbi:hypothetical protein V2E24_01000 [Mycoplasmopsis ciconiae]|uniref:Lipoprotein n=1 Tax=Mycoplasmopsis ciconiae TaxID=561067 RepID=A0ABU7MKW4_9BACT|nr:hypothetical protein [Mycoplasmopsis ciconiae]
MKKIKMLLTFSMASAATIPFVFVACSNNSTKEQTPQISLEREITFNSSKNINSGNYFMDSSTVLETNIRENDPLSTISAAQLFRIQTLKEPQYNLTPANEENRYSLLKPGLARYKMEHAFKVYVVILKDNKEEIITFDNDNVDLSIEVPNYSLDQYVFATTNDKKSINSPYFKEVMSKALRFEIEVKKGNYWVDSTGQKTDYEINALDFWYGFLRSYYTGFFQRRFRGHNGNIADSANSDAYNLEKVKDNSKWAGTLFTNTQQFRINGLDSTKFIDFEKLNDSNFLAPKNAVKDNKLVFETLDVNDAANTQFEFFDLLLAKSLIFNAAPSAYINQLKQQYPLEDTFEKNTNDNKQKVYKNGQGIVYQVGTYYYGTSGFANNLYAGAYYPDKNLSQDNSKVVFVKNKNYVDKEFVNSESNLEKINFVTKQNLNQEQEFNNFINGDNTILNYDQLNTQQKNLIQKDIKENKFNSLYFKELKKNKSIGLTYFNVTPAPGILSTQEAKDNFTKIAFNENFAKLVYSANFDEINKGFKGAEFDQNRKSIGSGFFENMSVSFRNLLNLALNYDFINNDLYQNKNLWLTNAAPDAKFGGSNQSESKIKTPRDAAKLINELILFDYNGDILMLQENEIDQANPYKSKYFNQAKEQIKKLLDKFYSDNNLDANQKISWVVYNSKLLNTKEEETFKKAINVWKELDNRLDPQFILLSDPQKINSTFGISGNGNNSFAQYTEYQYEYDSLSPYLDKITHNIGMSPFALWYKFSVLDPNDKLAQNFPQLTRFAKEMKSQFEKGNLKYNEFNVDGSVQNRRMIEWDDLNKLDSYEERNLYLAAEYNKDKQTYENKGFGGFGYKWDNQLADFVIDNITEQSKFAKHFIKISTNEQLAQLLKELNLWRGFYIDLDKSIPSINRAQILISQKYIKPVIAYNNVMYVRDWKVQKDKK